MYPNIYCSSHDHVAPGYVACKHVRNAADVVVYEAATDQALGTVACSRCADKLDDHEYVMDNFICICADAVREMGIGV